MRWPHGLAVLAPLLLTGACSAETGQEAGSPSTAADDGDQGPHKIECALQGAPSFTRDCTLERVTQGDEFYLVVRHPDGAFRRFKVLKDGRGVAAADGADEARTHITDGVLEASIGKDRYRLPKLQQIRHEPTS